MAVLTVSTLEFSLELHFLFTVFIIFPFTINKIMEKNGLLCQNILHVANISVSVGVCMYTYMVYTYNALENINIKFHTRKYIANALKDISNMLRSILVSCLWTLLNMYGSGSPV